MYVWARTGYAAEPARRLCAVNLEGYTISDDAIVPLSDAELTLETDRLILRPLDLSDEDVAIALFSDPDVVKYVCDVMTPDAIAEHLPIEVNRGAGGRIGIWVLLRKDTGEKLGSAVLLPLPIEAIDTDWSLLVPEAYPDADIEVGYLLRPSAWGHGFATEACTRLLQFGFEHTSLDEIVAVTDQKNTASKNVLQKSGLRAEGLRRAYREDCSAFRLTRAEWRAAQL